MHHCIIPLPALKINYSLDLRESSYLPYNSNSESAHVLNLLGLVEL